MTSSLTLLARSTGPLVGKIALLPCSLSTSTSSTPVSWRRRKAHQSTAKPAALKNLSTLTLLKLQVGRRRRGVVSLSRAARAAEKLVAEPRRSTTPSLAPGCSGRRPPSMG